ncbi:hypothetical protein Y032_0002g563 [Ancylostoma ceylanicum]|uniref:Uncharacterized protein n=1 Tax=Ancylostoma ceylanicum TaxID=53326 RepID=A0A016W075_9BILA|nr:hypothetical protein Y032_0002g563 [Ancylostoma ceylanicum]
MVRRHPEVGESLETGPTVRDKGAPASKVEETDRCGDKSVPVPNVGGEGSIVVIRVRRRPKWGKALRGFHGVERCAGNQRCGIAWKNEEMQKTGPILRKNPLRPSLLHASLPLLYLRLLSLTHSLSFLFVSE